MALRWKYETWRKLYVRETGSFAALSFYARCLARELLAMVDDEGLIHLKGRAPADAIAFQGGAATGDRRMLRRHVQELLEDGYIVHVGDTLAMPNFIPAQQGVDRVPDRSPKPTPVEHEPGSNEDRTEHEPSTNRDRTEHEPGSKSDSSADDSNGTDLALIPCLALPEREADPVKEFARAALAHLNAKTGRAFRADAKAVLDDCRKLVRAGRTVTEAIAVIDAKCDEWLTDPKMRRQLRPSTLLRPSNFQTYLDNDVDTGAAVDPDGEPPPVAWSYE
jgi:uncharacterized phage protein (TIGR02220 family)